MFNIFKKKPVWSPSTILSPSDGTALLLQNVDDPVFAQGAMGTGVAVNPSSDDVYAPVSGTITMIASTKHGIGITTAEGREILIHMGIDTVELKGKPFRLSVNKGDSVKAGDLLAKMDCQAVVESGRLSTIIVVETNSANRNDQLAETHTGTIKHGAVIAIFSD